MWTGVLAAAALTVSAAASLTDVLTELATRYQAATGERVQINPGASNTLARQIIEGAPVDVFISADELQMNAVVKAGRMAPGSTITLLSNELVIAVPKGAPAHVNQPRDLVGAHVRRIAMGQPESVPAGVYGRQWLERLDLWKAVQPKVVPMPTVRAALAAVRERRVDAAIVYATDARTTTDVRVAYRVPSGESPRIVYPAAVVAGPHETSARRFLAYLQSDEARRVFEAAGFIVAPPTPPKTLNGPPLKTPKTLNGPPLKTPKTPNGPPLKTPKTPNGPPLKPPKTPRASVSSR
jgi:molybdate transport system substrate-binding protein